MSYYLSESDVKILKQTINTVNNLPSSQGNKSRPTIKHAFAYVELTEQNEDGLWSAKEVYFDETGTASELVDGRTWGADSVYIIVNGTVSVGQVVRVEAYYMVDANGAEQAVWVGSAIGGGGTSMFRFKVLADFSSGKGDQSLGKAELVDEHDIVLDNGSTIILTQNKFTEADFFEGEILYAITANPIFPSPLYTYYLLDPFLAGIGGTSA